MPDMDGFAVAEKIRENSGLAGATIMMLTSDLASGDRERCRQLGIAATLVKPIQQSELLDAILSTLALNGGAMPASQPRISEAKTKRTGATSAISAGRRQSSESTTRSAIARTPR